MLETMPASTGPDSAEPVSGDPSSGGLTFAGAARADLPSAGASRADPAFAGPALALTGSSRNPTSAGSTLADPGGVLPFSPAEIFIATHTALARPALVPEVELYLATEITPIWQATEDWLAERNIEPPFWAFAWPGSQALARVMLDGIVPVAGRRVLDFAAGGGLAAIAAMLTGAASAEAAEIDPLALAATRLNARHNGVTVATPAGDVVGSACRWDCVLAGDVCYEAPMTGHIMPWLRRLAGEGAEVLLADPGRTYLPREGLVAVSRFLVPTLRELEDRDQREVTIYRVLG
jgi:predicted nicotinamide N-methyase